MVRRPSLLVLACALLSAAGCGDDGGGADAATHTEEPLWSREFPASDGLGFQLAAWPGGNSALFGLIGSKGGVVFDGFALGASGPALPYIARLDGSGNVQHAAVGEPPPEGGWQGFAFAADPDGSLYLEGAIVPDPYAGVLGDYVIMKIGPDDAVAWSRAFPLAPTAGITSLAVTPGGVLNAFGSFTGLVDLGGGAIAARGGGPDNFRLRLDTNGTFISADVFGHPTWPFGKVAVSKTGLVASVNTGGDGTWYVQLLEADGRLSWSHTFGSYSLPNGGFHVAFIGDDVVVGAGIGEGTDLGGGQFPAGVPPKFAVGRFDRTGGLVWQRAFGSDYNAYLSGLAVGAAGDIALCGFVSHLSDEAFVFDSVTIPWAPPDSYEFGFSFVGKLTGSGDARWAQKIVGVSTNLFDEPVCAVDAAGAVIVVDPLARTSVLYVGKYAP